MGILQFISSRNFITVNKDLIIALGIEEAIILGELASENDYWERQEQLEDGYFYSTVENIKANTTLSDYQQRKSLNKLKDMNLIDVKVKGIPAKRYIKINEEQVLELFNNITSKKLSSSSKKTKELDVKKLKRNNNIINNNINNNNKENIYIAFGEYKRVKLTQEEYNKLIEDYDKEFVDIVIQRLDEYVESNNNKNKYENFNLVIRKAIRERWFVKAISNIPSWFNEEIKSDEREMTNEERREFEAIKNGTYGKEAY